MCGVCRFLLYNGQAAYVESHVRGPFFVCIIYTNLTLAKWRVYNSTICSKYIWDELLDRPHEVSRKGIDGVSKRSQQLFDNLVKISENCHEAAIFFAKGLDDLSNTEWFAAKVKEYEKKGDEFTSDLVTLLNATYITPLDREDFLQLAFKLDDIIDGLEACTVRFDLYAVNTATEAMRAFAHTIVLSTEEISQAITKLSARKLTAIRQHTLRINNLEKEGDTVLRDSLRALFQEYNHDVLHVIKLKEVYEILESVTDRCEDVGDVLDSITVKNA